MWKRPSQSKGKGKERVKSYIDKVGHDMKTINENVLCKEYV